MKERLLFVAAGLAQVPIIREARALGYYTIGMDGDAAAPGLQASHERCVANILDADEIVRIARRTRAQGVVSACCDVAMESVAEACAALGFPGTPKEVVRISRDKWLQREAIRAAGLLVPKYACVSDGEEAMQAWDRFQPAACVIKPVDASGSRGVRFVAERSQVPSAFEVARQNSRSGRVMVESFVPGTEFSVEAWVDGDEVYVLATSEKVRTDPPYLLDRQVHFPDSLSTEDRAQMKSEAVRAIRACGFRDCPVHLECIHSPEGFVIVELSARGAGFKVFSEILPRITGVSTALCSIQLGLGMKPDVKSSIQSMAASLVFIDPVPGNFISAHGIEEMRSLPGVSEVELYVKPGQTMNELRSGADRAGHILVYDADASTCRGRAQEVLRGITLEIEPSGSNQTAWSAT